MTNSILTNMSAMTAVANLAATQKNLAQVQNEISTGLSISSASDNAAYYSISTSMNTENSNLSAVTSSLNLGASVLTTATSALSSMTGILNKISADLVSAQQAGTDKNSIGIDIASLQNQLKSTIGAAAFNGVNLLDGSQVGTASGGANTVDTAQTGASFVSGVNGSGASTVVNFLTVDGTKSNFGQFVAATGTPPTGGSNSGSLFNVSVADASSATPGTTANVDILAGSTAAPAGTGATPTPAQYELKVDSNTTSAQLTTFIAAIGAALSNVNTASESLGAAQKNVDLQSTFISSLSDSITSGVSSLVDADMNAASTRLSALQTQQQLGVQALSVANQNSQLILKLFQ